MTPTPPKPPIVFGEVLFDHFPDGKHVLGGAPFNVAWDLHGLGVESLFLSAVGEDDEGREILGKMSEWGMRTDGVQIEDQSTGKVAVSFDNGQPSYEIVHPVAFDFISPPTIELSTDKYSLLYLGSLAFRSEVSQRTLTQIIESTDLPRFVDVNIRDPWFDTAWLDVLIQDATWVKMSDEELIRLSSISHCDDRDHLIQGTAELERRYNVDTFLITAGASGAYLIQNETIIHAPAPKPPTIADTVGAGDSFAAAMIAGFVREDSPQPALERAAAFASRVCGLSGATTNDRSFYCLD